MIAARPITADELRALTSSSDYYIYVDVKAHRCWRVFQNPAEAALVVSDDAVYADTQDELELRLRKQLGARYPKQKVAAGTYRTSRINMPAGAVQQIDSLIFSVSAEEDVSPFASYADFYEAVDLMGGQPLIIDFAALRELIKGQPIEDSISRKYFEGTNVYAPNRLLVVGSLVVSNTDACTYRQVAVYLDPKRAKRIISARLRVAARKAAPRPFDGMTGYSALRDLARSMLDLLLPEAPFENSGVHYPTWDTYDRFFSDILHLCRRIPDLYALLEKFNKGAAARKLMKSALPGLLHFLPVISRSLAAADAKRVRYILETTKRRQESGISVYHFDTSNEARKIRHKFLKFLLKEIIRGKIKNGKDRFLEIVRAAESKFGVPATEFSEPSSCVAAHADLVSDAAPAPVVSPGIEDGGLLESVPTAAPGVTAACESTGSAIVSS